MKLFRSNGDQFFLTSGKKLMLGVCAVIIKLLNFQCLLMKIPFSENFGSS